MRKIPRIVKQLVNESDLSHRTISFRKSPALVASEHINNEQVTSRFNVKRSRREAKGNRKRIYASSVRLLKIIVVLKRVHPNSHDV